MSDYRRLISYIYAYEGAVKGKNIGFAKLESRNGQCRIGVSVKKVYVGGNDLGVYLLSDRGEILLGKIFIRSGSGEFRTSVRADNVEDSGRGLENCYGLTIHDVKDSWRSYTTIWDDGAARDTEDTVTRAAEIELAGVTSENLKKEKQETEETENSVTPFQLFQAPPPQITADFECSGAIVSPQPLPEEPEKEGEDLYRPAPERWAFGEARQEDGANGVYGGRERTEAVGKAGPVTRYMSGTASPREELNRLSGVWSRPEIPAEPAVQPEIPLQPQPMPEILQPSAPAGSPRTPEEPDPSAPRMSRPAPHPGTQSGSLPGAVSGKEEEMPEEREAELPGEPEEGPEPGALLEPEVSGEAVWSRFRKQYPKIDVFDYENGCEVLKIRPQDIGLLPRENWVYGNNSFLLHGYYNYQCLILVRLNNPNGRARFLLGVPGHYFSSEKYMASMFGFPHFVLSKKQPMENGRFGYWYTDVRLGQ